MERGSCVAVLVASSTRTVLPQQSCEDRRPIQPTPRAYSSASLVTAPHELLTEERRVIMSVCVLCVEGGSAVSKTQMPDLIVRCEQVPDVIIGVRLCMHYRNFKL